MKARRRTKLLFYLTISLSAFILLVFVRHSGHLKENAVRSRRQTGEESPPDDEYYYNYVNDEQPPPELGNFYPLENELPPESLPIEFENIDEGFEPRPGELICDQPRSAVLPVEIVPEKTVISAVLETNVVITENDLERIPLVKGWRKPVGQKIGCCPIGDRNGEVYTEGFACCGNTIYNFTQSFCCPSRFNRVYDISPDNFTICYGNGSETEDTFCRESDFNLDIKTPLDARCEFNKEKQPVKCTFVCPSGTVVRGDKTAICNDNGVWNGNAECCEGCPAEYKQDIWFIVDIDDGIGVANMADIRSFIRGLVSFFPVSQEQVRVAVTAFNRVVFTTQGTWDLGAHDNLESLSKAITNLPDEGIGRNTQAALNYVAISGFTKANGDRPDVGDTTILITTGDPDSPISAGATALRALGRFIIVAIGPDVSANQFESHVSRPPSENYIRIPEFDFTQISNRRDFLYRLLCTEGCVGGK